MPCHLILPFQKAILPIIPYHFTKHPTTQNSIFFPFYLNILFYSFFFYYFSFSIPFPLFLPQPLAPISTHRTTHTHTNPWYTNPPIQTHHHTHINTNYQTINWATHINPSNQSEPTIATTPTNRSQQQPPLGVELDNLGIITDESNRTIEWGADDFVAVKIDVRPLHQVVEFQK